MRIKSIRKIDNCSLKRYDIQTKNHNFFANGILVHNSLIKVVRLGDDFLISTNGTINAFGCQLPNDINCPFSNFGDLFLEGMKHYGLSREDFPRLFEEGYTYMFELTSPYNQVVVKFPETKVSLIGIRHNASGKEIRFSDHALSGVFDTPKVFPLHSAEECVAAASVLPDNNEGYVVCDAQFRRVKIKSPRYVQLHYMASNQVWSPSRVIDIVRSNEIDEYVAYFPRFKSALDAFKQRYDCYLDSLNDLKVQIDKFKSDGMSKKDFAIWLMGDSDKKVLAGFAFKYFDGKVDSVKQFIDELDNNKLCSALGM